MQSCRVCGMSRVFDEASFHFSPSLKKDLITSGRLPKSTVKMIIQMQDWFAYV
jgi:hypothetical protein